MGYRFWCVLTLAAALGAASKPPVTGRGENQNVIVTATIYSAPEEIEALLGAPLYGDFLVAEVTVEPKSSQAVALDPDDFTLRTDKSGEHTGPLAANQVVGRDAFVIKRKKTDPDRRVLSIAAADDKLEQRLAGRALAAGPITQATTGLLYFPMEPQKTKDLELLYGSVQDRARIRFR
jgi:hypothetical protein